MKFNALVFACAVVATALFVSSSIAAEWPRPVIVPQPDQVAGVKSPVVSLNGNWKFTLTPPSEFWKNSVEPTDWNDVVVPAEPWMQGLRIERDKEYPYKKQITIPKEFAGQRILLRFDGVYSVGRVWINGEFAGQHYGGFQSWNLDITDKVQPGKPAWITVGITDLTHDLSFASGYASRYLGVNDVPHYIGGILRDVMLVAVPQAHISRVHYVTDLDDDYKDATLRIVAEVANSGDANQKLALRYTLNGTYDSKKTIWQDSSAETSVLSSKSVSFEQETKIIAPALWDAEHPNLYTLKVELLAGRKVIETLTRKVGFREVLVRGTELLVNGKRIKMRGGCRHSVHPTAGRAYVPELAEMDVKLYKEANFNYIRTSHYPTTPHFLDLCDKYGIYVEEEMAIVWLDHHAARGKLNDLRDDPKALPYFMRAISETLERDKSHPSIIMWSLGNENVKWGKNFEMERDYARKEDPTRPLKTGHNAYGGGWNTAEYLDIDSYHYPSVNSDYSRLKSGKPYLADENVHVMCYYGKNSFADRDPNVRNYWGESMKACWENMYQADTVLGSAIWGTIDEVFLCPERALGYGRWGIFDGWRRRKPEFWHARKSHSPIRIENKPLGNPGTGKALRIPIKNWFDHTDFSELAITWQVEKERGEITMSLPPGGAEGELVVPARNWKDSDTLQLSFSVSSPAMSRVIDEFALPLVKQVQPRTDHSGAITSLNESPEQTVIAGKNFRLVFDKSTGQIVEGIFNGESLIVGGPQLNLTPFNLPPFKLTDFTSRIIPPGGAKAGIAEVVIKGGHGEIGVMFNMQIAGNGAMQLSYTVNNPPEKGSFDEVGVTLLVPFGMDRISWNRNGLWSVFPEDHIGRNSGTAIKLRAGKSLVYREEPKWPWYHDMKDFHQYGKEHSGYGMTHDFRAAKEYFNWVELYRDGAKGRLRVESDGKIHSARVGTYSEPHKLSIDNRDKRVIYKGTWTHAASAGGINNTESYSSEKGASAEIAFTGRSVAWVSCRNHNLGLVDLYLDGVIVAKGLDAYASAKQYNQVLFQKTGLTDGAHILKVVVTGEKNPESDGAYVLVDGVTDVITKTSTRQALYINRDWTYLPGWGCLGRQATLADGFTDTVWIDVKRKKTSEPHKPTES